MNALESLYGFELDDHHALNQEIDSIATVSHLTTINEWQCLVTLNEQSAIQPFIGPSHFTGRFQHSRSQFMVDRNRCADGRCCQCVRLFLHVHESIQFVVHCGSFELSRKTWRFRRRVVSSALCEFGGFCV